MNFSTRKVLGREISEEQVGVWDVEAETGDDFEELQKRNIGRPALTRIFLGEVLIDTAQAGRC